MASKKGSNATISAEGHNISKLTLNLPIVGKVADDRHLHLLRHGGMPFRWG